MLIEESAAFLRRLTCKYFRLCRRGQPLQQPLCSSATRAQSSHRQHLTEWAWICANKTLFKKTAGANWAWAHSLPTPVLVFELFCTFKYLIIIFFKFRFLSLVFRTFPDPLISAPIKFVTLICLYSLDTVLWSPLCLCSSCSLLI